MDPMKLRRISAGALVLQALCSSKTTPAEKAWAKEVQRKSAHRRGGAVGDSAATSPKEC